MYESGSSPFPLVDHDVRLNLEIITRTKGSFVAGGKQLVQRALGIAVFDPVDVSLYRI